MPQPKDKTEEQPTAVDVAKDRDTPKPAVDALAFTVEDYRARGDALLGAGFTLPDIRAAFGELPKTRELTPADAKQRVRDWLSAPMTVEPPIVEENA
jgi:hypothetical protein